ncbi:MAG: hypothetical protein HC804_08440 [Anaerolineae bacterium]|nr:hypothetical protein [Anaerolineae bacterium]
MDRKEQHDKAVTASTTIHPPFFRRNTKKESYQRRMHRYRNYYYKCLVQENADKDGQDEQEPTGSAPNDHSPRHATDNRNAAAAATVEDTRTIHSSGSCPAASSSCIPSPSLSDQTEAAALRRPRLITTNPLCHYLQVASSTLSLSSTSFEATLLPAVLLGVCSLSAVAEWWDYQQQVQLLLQTTTSSSTSCSSILKHLVSFYERRERQYQAYMDARERQHGQIKQRLVRVFEQQQNYHKQMLSPMASLSSLRRPPPSHPNKP